MVQQSSPHPRIRVKIRERVEESSRHRDYTPGRSEKMLMIILGAAIGLGIGYLLAGKALSLLHKTCPAPLPQHAAPPLAERDREKKTPLPVIDFDLPFMRDS